MTTMPAASSWSPSTSFAGPALAWIERASVSGAPFSLLPSLSSQTWPFAWMAPHNTLPAPPALRRHPAARGSRTNILPYFRSDIYFAQSPQSSSSVKYKFIMVIWIVKRDTDLEDVILELAAPSNAAPSLPSDCLPPSPPPPLPPSSSSPLTMKDRRTMDA